MITKTFESFFIGPYILIDKRACHRRSDIECVRLFAFTQTCWGWSSKLLHCWIDKLLIFYLWCLNSDNSLSLKNNTKNKHCWNYCFLPKGLKKICSSYIWKIQALPIFCSIIQHNKAKLGLILTKTNSRMKKENRLLPIILKERGK